MLEFGALPQTPKIKTRRRFYSAPIPYAAPGLKFYSAVIRFTPEFKINREDAQRYTEEKIHREVEKVEEGSHKKDVRVKTFLTSSTLR
jgi:hypothetical protein